MKQLSISLSILVFQLEEVPVKRMDRPSATETERGRASETDIGKNAKDVEMPLK